MSGEDEFARIRAGIWGESLGQAVHLDIQSLRLAIENLAQQIQMGQLVTQRLSNNVGMLTAEIAGLSIKLDQKASQSSIDDLKSNVKTDFSTLDKKLDIVIKNTGNKGPGPI